MAIEVKKVLAALQLKFKGKSLSKTFLDKTATRYAEKIPTDADMDDYINEREDDILAAGEEADRRVTAALKKPAEGDKTKVENKEPEIDEDELKDAPPYVKVMMKQMKGMSDTITSLQAEKTAETISQRFLKDERLKGISPKLLSKWVPKTEAEYEATVLEAAEDLKEFAKPDEGESTDQTKPKIGTRLGQGGFGDKPVHTTTKVAVSAADKAKEVPQEIKDFTATLNKTAVKQTA